MNIHQVGLRLLWTCVLLLLSSSSLAATTTSEHAQARRPSSSLLRRQLQQQRQQQDATGNSTTAPPFQVIDDPTSSNIVGGVIATKPYPAYGFAAGNILCGATLIHPDIAVSAGHCKGAFVGRTNGLYLGGTRVDGSTSTYYSVTSERRHPAFNANSLLGDILLIQLSQVATGVTPQPYNADPSFPAVNAAATIIGYGLTSQNGQYVSANLREATSNVVSFNTCNNYYGTINDATQLCLLSSSGKDTCQGDSGGPVFVNGIQVGITSFGDGCGLPGVPAVYTRLSGFTQFITQGICELSSVPPAVCANIAPSPTVTSFGGNTNGNAGTLGSCFSSANTVLVRDKGLVTMDRLRIGDFVQVDTVSDQYSRIISFGHLDHKNEASYLQLYSADSHTPLEISRDHMVMMSGQTTSRAGDLKVGDALSNGVVVDRIDVVQRRGLYAPVTEAGVIVVSGVQSSCYVGLLKLPPTLQHYAYHIGMGPMRLLCYRDFDFWCANETYTEYGISTYIATIVQGLSFVATLSAFFQVLIGALIGVPLLITIFFLEKLMASPIVVLAMVFFVRYRAVRGRVISRKNEKSL